MTDFNPLAAGAPPPAPGPIQGERHVSEVAGRGPVMSKRAGIGVIVAGAVVLCAIILLTAEKPKLEPESGPELVAARPVVRYEAPPPPMAVQPAVGLLPSQPPPPPTQAAFAAGSPASAKPARPQLLVYTSSGSSGTGGAGAGRMPPNPYGDSAVVSAEAPTAVAGYAESAGFPGADGGLDGRGRGQAQAEDMHSRLTPTRLTGVSANVLRNQPYLLTLGTLVPCILQTAMDSTLPGFVTCVIPQDVQGKTGLTLLDRGTLVVGEFRGGVSQGVERFFVVWTRAETPQGVVINLDSPATDPLGRSGMGGDVDRHFWQRFGGALLLTTVDGAIQAGVASAAKSGTTTINTGQTQGIVAETLRGTINIPPTIRKNQGELVSIFVARDLDFSTVYRVQPAPPRYVSEQGRYAR